MAGRKRHDDDETEVEELSVDSVAESETTHQNETLPCGCRVAVVMTRTVTEHHSWCAEHDPDNPANQVEPEPEPEPVES